MTTIISTSVKEFKWNMYLLSMKLKITLRGKKVFDNAAAIRKDEGEKSYQVLKYEKDANKVVHFSNWSSISKAKLFFESPELVKIRIEAGVKAPEFIYLHELENGLL